MTDPAESASDKAIREALESVDRLERERTHSSETIVDDGADGEAVEVLPPDDDDVPPSGDAFTSTPPQPAARKTVDQAMIESLLKAKAETAEVLAQTQKEAKDMFDRLARVSADFENYKKRVGREKDDAIKFGNEKAFKEILPVVDNLRRALQSAGGADPQLIEGVKLVSKQLEDAVARFGVTGFDSLGTPFDPARHEAVGSRAHESIPAQHVCEEYQRGYQLHDRLLRPALVIVSSGPAEN
ncbi:MAG: nucleotide exchange factor GrpE [Deltaproteobacteria bacterium]|nr:nucleotide exchange factor GrpE [Deltaproteobacteria bacterium]